MYQLPNQIDPTLPGTLPPDHITNWPSLLDQLLSDLFTPVNPPLLDLGNNLLAGLAAIVVVWTGLRIAFSGGFQAWDLVRLVIGLSIPLGMLRFYAVEIPGVGFTFPGLIPAGANQIAELFQADIVDEMNKAMQTLQDRIRNNVINSSQGGDFSFNNWINAFFEAATAVVISIILGLFFMGAFAAIYAISMAQVFWAQTALSILIFLGPVFIPWLVWEPMKFLFWGWFRAMITYSLYGVIASAVMRVWCSLALTVMNSVTSEMLSFTEAAGATSGVYIVAIIPLLVGAVMSATKIPQLANALVTGGGGGGGGIGGLAAGAMSAGGGKMAKLAGGAK